jgi:hypothetical protein
MLKLIDLDYPNTIFEELRMQYAGIDNYFYSGIPQETYVFTTNIQLSKNNLMVMQNLLKDYEYGVDSTGGFINKYNGTSKTITIPVGTETIIDISASAFRGLELERAILPNNLRSIGMNAFAENNLTSIDLPNSTTTIWDGAFKRNKLTSIHIPGTIEIINSEAFADNNISEIYLEDGIKTINEGAFANNPLQKIRIGSRVNIREGKISIMTSNGSREIPLAFPKEFVDSYYANGAKAGSYILSGNTWKYTD